MDFPAPLTYTRDMARSNDALNLAGVALAAALGLLAFMQWRSSRAFSADAVALTGTVVELRTAKKAIFDADNDVFPTVEYRLEGDDSPRRAELATPLAKIGLEPERAVGSAVPLMVDPAAPGRPRHGRAQGRESALVLLALAFGALFAPAILRRSVMGRGGGGG